MKKYRSLKDLPGYPKGTIFISQVPYGYKPESTNKEGWFFYFPSIIMDLTEWFEKIIEKQFTKEIHRERHILLHKEFDELLADFIGHTEKGVTDVPIIELLKWSYKQTQDPDE